MKILLKIEEAFLFFLSIYLFSNLNFDWWWFPILLFTPDISILGYLINNNIGAIIYNIIHNKALSITFYIIGSIIKNPILQLIGIILLAHSSLDRVFHFGLKYKDDFKHTHLN